MGPRTPAISAKDTSPIPAPANAIRSAIMTAAANRNRRRYSTSLLAEDPTDKL